MISEAIIENIIDAAKHLISDIRPSVWAEKNIMMSGSHAGLLKYSDTTPYTREIIDLFAKDDPTREIALMGSAQFGKTGSIILPLLGYLIENDPGNILMTVGSEGLLKEAMADIDSMIDRAGLRHLIKPSANRKKITQTGDTDTIKQFADGYLKLAHTSNVNIFRQANYRVGIFDDYDAIKGNNKHVGDIRDTIEKRFTAHAKTKKIIYISSPQLAQTSNIYKVYMMGDQRKFFVPCPDCGDTIQLLWTQDLYEGVKRTNAELGGVYWKMNEDNTLDESSVGYICPACGEFFTDHNKISYVTKGFWKPTAKPYYADFKSFYMNSLYSPAFMDDWLHYVRKYIECHPIGQPQIKTKYQTFLNLNMGLPYEDEGETIKANKLQHNIRNYAIGDIPEDLSIKDGNGRIILLTCACDLNGALEDARLDYEIVAHSETGSTYSIDHGSIGTFIPRENSKKKKGDRLKFTYELDRPNSVWPILDSVLKKYSIINGKKRIIPIAIDTGFCDKQVWEYIDKSNWYIRGVKGDKEDKYIRHGVDVAHFKKSHERPEKLYILQGGLIKDRLAELVNLRWDSGNDDSQPSEFMNFPTPAEGKYLYTNYFEHYESETRQLISKDGEAPMFRWAKVKTTSQNHLFDCRCYNMAIRNIFVYEIGRSMKIKDFVWSDYVKLALGK